MGWDGQLGALPVNVPTQPPPLARAENPAGNFVLTSADLYRVSCRACHKPDGSGVPPQINSIIGPVQSASVEWTTAQMKEKGRPIDPKFIRQLTSLTETDLRKRLKVGGHDMPSFAHLSDDEIRVLRPYLDALARVPGPEHQQRQIAEPAARVGELIVKGTCHICHDATGPDIRPTPALSDAIPPLAAFPRQKTLAQFAQKVREGAPAPLSAGGVSSTRRMPVFNYLSEAEVAAVYSYLIVRRDNVEHLLMIGGPTDLVVEPNIVRAVGAREVTREPSRVVPPSLSVWVPHIENGWPLQPAGEPAATPAPRPYRSNATEEPWLAAEPACGAHLPTASRRR